MGNHRLTVDEPPSLGGTDLGPTPVQMLLASWLGCINVMLNRIAQKRGLEIGSLALEAEATLVTDGVQLIDEVAVPIRKLALKLTSAPGLTEAQHRDLLADLDKYCPLSGMLRACGTEVIKTWDPSPT